LVAGNITERMKKGIAIRSLALLILMLLVIIIIIFVLFTYAPQFVDSIVNMIYNPPEIKS